MSVYRPVDGHRAKHRDLYISRYFVSLLTVSALSPNPPLYISRYFCQFIDIHLHKQRLLRSTTVDISVSLLTLSRSHLLFGNSTIVDITCVLLTLTDLPNYPDLYNSRYCCLFIDRRMTQSPSSSLQ